MFHGRNSGKKLKACLITRQAFNLIHLVTGKNPLWWNPVSNCQVSKKSGAKNYTKQEMLDRGMILKGRFSKHRYLYTRTNRKSLTINSRQTDSLIFTRDGKIIK